MGLFYPDEDFANLLTDRGDLFLKYLFNKYYADLCKLSFKYVGRTDIAEDLVQDVFINIWNKRNTLDYKGNIRPCLTTSVVNTSLNFIKSKFARQVFVQDDMASQTTDNHNQHEELVGRQLHQLIGVAIEQLPDRCRAIFTLSRYSDLSYKEISAQLDISVKTVEAQMSIALKRIHEFLSKFGYAILSLLFFDI